MDPEKIGKFICQLRKEKNLSQYQLADMIPISRQGVSKWERGVTTPDPQTLLQLSEMFDVSINELLKGERLQTNTIEDLEQTTLSILDQSNKKTKIIKRITAISIIIITVLLLAFLSYYFINSYNSTKVYTIYGSSKNFSTADGLMIITKEKMYMKLGWLKNRNEYDIKNIRLYYTTNNKTTTMVEDSDIGNLIIKENIGYYEKIKESQLGNISKDIYLEITYDDDKTEVIKLKFVQNFSNNKLFFTKQPKGEKKVEVVKEEKTSSSQEVKKEEEKKNEETKPVIQEAKEQVKEQVKEETKIEEIKQEQQVQEESPKPVITTEQIITKIKETCNNMNSTYTCSYDNYNVIIMYDSSVNKISIYNERKYIGDYQVNEDAYVCFVPDCEQTIKEKIEKYLFS